MIQERFCSLELSKMLKEKGFDERCRDWYEDGNEIVESDDRFGYRTNSNPIGDYVVCSAPTHQVAMDWVREKGCYVEIHMMSRFDLEQEANVFSFFHVCVNVLMDGVLSVHDLGYKSKDYAECVEDALKYIIKNLI